MYAVDDETVSVVPLPGKPNKLFDYEKVYSDEGEHNCYCIGHVQNFF